LIEGSLFIGNPIYHFEQLESTNSSALDIISKSNPSEGTAIMTSFQTQGKGQYGRVWRSSKGKNILCSIILYPHFLSLENQFFLNVFSALAVRKLISGLVKSKVCIKWPNDIYIEDKKVAGILIQNSIQGLRLNSSVVGIGLNVNQTDFNKDLINPTSLYLENHKEYNLQFISKDLFRSFEKYYLALKSGKLEELKLEFEEHLYLKDVEKQFSLNNYSKNAVIKGINMKGQLAIAHDQNTHFYSHNEVKYL
jgi:BirA family biotin operon repressor/biotin-[acetyl-CoA-carboxylase] ligase